MLRTRVGYAGGRKQNPTYHDLGDHTEAFQVDFDPSRTSYEDLLKVFWADHDPCGGAWSRQYRSAIFHHDAQQRRVAERTRDGLGQTRSITTAIEPLDRFWLAEDYHQKHRLRSTPLFDEYATVYPTLDALLASVAVTRVNGYVGGYGTRASLDAEIDKLGLSDQSRTWLLKHAR
ncbi:MAG: methionine sulfoxide reductase [Planctomycetes bacterium]|nr:methionine sulfoxide reductase [Planctomycetota bacterium]